MTQKERIYLDHNATAPLIPEARAAMLAALEVVGNPSSVHHEGRAARALIEQAREEVAALVGARPGEVIFTSGATEANCWAASGRLWAAAAVGSIEHVSVLAPVKRLKAPHHEIPCAADGVLRVGEAVAFAREHAQSSMPVFVSVGLANGETGALQPVQELMTELAEIPAVLHVDAAQAAGRIPVDFHALGASLMSLSAHKMGGPKGVGALIVRDGVVLDPLLTGGGQERRRRAGTENVAAIAGFGAAARVARTTLRSWQQVGVLRDEMERELRRITPDVAVIGQSAARLPNTTLLAYPGTSAETTVIKLDLAGVAVSAGAACSSGKVGRSHVLAAMGLPDELARSAVRISLGLSTTADDVQRFLAIWGAMGRRTTLAA